MEGQSEDVRTMLSMNSSAVLPPIASDHPVMRRASWQDGGHQELSKAGLSEDQTVRMLRPSWAPAPRSRSAGLASVSVSASTESHTCRSESQNIVAVSEASDAHGLRSFAEEVCAYRAVLSL